MPQNLEQRRAAHADSRTTACRKQPGEGDCLSGYPSLIINNGLLAALAFSLEKKKQHERVADAIADHLHQMGIARAANNQPPSANSLLQTLISGDSQMLRRATDEALAYLAYLKRFARTTAE